MMYKLLLVVLFSAPLVGMQGTPDRWADVVGKKKRASSLNIQDTAINPNREGSEAKQSEPKEIEWSKVSSGKWVGKEVNKKSEHLTLSEETKKKLCADLSSEVVRKKHTEKSADLQAVTKDKEALHIQKTELEIKIEQIEKQETQTKEEIASLLTVLQRRLVQAQAAETGANYVDLKADEAIKALTAQRALAQENYKTYHNEGEKIRAEITAQESALAKKIEEEKQQETPKKGWWPFFSK